MTADALGLCLHISGAHARLNLRLHENLGAFHGLDYEDFRLLYLLVNAEGGRMAMADLARALGLPMSGLIRKMVLLEKTGLAERSASTNQDSRRHATIHHGGRQLMQAAVTTVEAICADAVKLLDPQTLAQIDTALLAFCPDDTLHA